MCLLRLPLVWGYFDQTLLGKQGLPLLHTKSSRPLWQEFSDLGCSYGRHVKIGFCRCPCVLLKYPPTTPIHLLEDRRRRHIAPLKRSVQFLVAGNIVFGNVEKPRRGFRLQRYILRQATREVASELETKVFQQGQDASFEEPSRTSLAPRHVFFTVHCGCSCT